MKKCKNCINDKTVRNIKFDKNNVCSYCNNYKEIEAKLTDKDNLKKLFEERIEKIRGKYDYDVAVGISGGKDSVFVLYELINKYKLKVKTFTMNNGFLSDSAKENIDKIIEEFDVEHEYIEFDQEVLKRFYNYSMNKWLVPCIACSYIGYTTMINYTSKINAGLCIHGRSPEQMFRCYGNDVFTSLVNMGLEHVDSINVSDIYNKLLNDISVKIDKKLMKDLKKILLKDVNENDFREFVAYFLYHEYNEKEIVEFLKENTSWKIDENYNHYDCDIHNAAKYIYQCAEGRPHILPEVSVLVRNKTLTREEAINKLKNETILKKPKNEMKLLCNFANISEVKVLLKARFYNLYNRLVKR